MKVVWWILTVFVAISSIGNFVEGMITGDKGVLSWSVICALIALACYMFATEED